MLVMRKGGKWIMMRNCKNNVTQRGSIAVIFLLAVWLFWGSITVWAAEEESVRICRQELLDMMCNVDSSWHDISALNLTISEINEIWWDLIENEGYVEYNSYDVIYVTYKFSNGYATHMSLVGLDDEYPLRYASIKNHISIVQQATKGMTDMEKVLFVNEYVNDLTYYYYGSDHLKARVSGPLYKGYSTCQGYTEAIRMLLRHVGIPVAFVASSTINHSWDMVQIDGEWYHMDATWDDAKGQGGTNTKHTYFIRNDYEYENNLPNRHYNWVVRYMDIKSTATDYTNWFVHDVKGKMHYYDGLWYYIDSKTGDIVRSEVDVNQSGYEVLIDKDTNNNSSLLINKVENNILYYTANGVACEKSLITEEEIQPVGLDWSNADYWRSGHYELNTGIYAPNSARICLKDYIKIESGNQYQVQISDKDYRVLIREMTADKEYVASWNLHGGGIFTTSADTAYLAVSVYSPSKTPTFVEYDNMLRNGLTVKIDLVGRMKIDTIDWSNVKYWRNGYYLPENGKYQACQSKICLRDYLAVKKKKNYKVIISNNAYNMIIHELTEDGKYVNSHDLRDGDTFGISSDTSYLSVYLYCVENQSECAQNYMNDISAGMRVGLIENADEMDVNNTLLWNDKNYWRSGCYSVINGMYEYCEDRICLVDYVLADNTQKYKVDFKDRRYHMLIREMDEEKRFIKSNNLVSGEVFAPTEKTVYIAISLYLPEKGTYASYSDYVDVIQAGVGLQTTDAAASVSVLMLEEEFIEEIETTEEVTEEEMTSEIAEEETEITEEAEEEEVTTEESETTEEVTEEEIVEEEAESTEIEPMHTEEESGTTEEESQEASETPEVVEESEEEEEAEITEL